jgi:AmiR/NasT family two-component response regulator
MAAEISRLRILVHDPAPLMAAAVKDLLHFVGVRDVVVAKDLREAMAALMLRPWDVVFTDWDPETRAENQLATRIRHGDFDINRYLSVVVTINGVTPDVVHAARDSGANEIMVKPLTGTSIREKLMSVVANPRSFVETDAFFGPDRRRRRGNFGGQDRRGQRD